VRARSLSQAGFLAAHQNDNDAATPLFQEALEIEVSRGPRIRPRRGQWRGGTDHVHVDGLEVARAGSISPLNAYGFNLRDTQGNTRYRVAVDGEGNPTMLRFDVRATSSGAYPNRAVTLVCGTD
jgi:hypothetical protein